MPFKRSTYSYLEVSFQDIHASELPKPVVFMSNETPDYYELGMLIGKVISSDETVDGKPLIYAVSVEGNEVELIGDVDCKWATDGDSFDRAVLDSF